MNGLELSRKYFEEVGLPMLQEQFSQYMPRIAAGLVGEGSECLGFDDEISQDHDFGPAFCLWLNDEDYKNYGSELQRAYDNLDGEFEGFAARKVSNGGAGRVGVLKISDFYAQFIGDEQPPKTMRRWLYLPEDKLAIATSGEVFVDELGEFTSIRDALKGYYPEPVRVKKIAARAAKMAQSGQYNYARCMRRGDVVAANLALDEFLKSTISMVYLLNKTYMPYYKWMFRGMKDFTVLPQVASTLAELVLCGDTSEAWREPHGENWNPYVNSADKRVRIIEQICGAVIEELKRQGLTDINDDFLEAHAWKIMEKVGDPELKRCHVMEG